MRRNSFTDLLLIAIFMGCVGAIGLWYAMPEPQTQVRTLVFTRTPEVVQPIEPERSLWCEYLRDFEDPEVAAITWMDDYMRYDTDVLVVNTVEDALWTRDMMQETIRVRVEPKYVMVEFARCGDFGVDVAYAFWPLWIGEGD